MFRITRWERRARCGRLGLVLLVALALPTLPAVAGATPTLGFVENWPGISLSTWGGGSVISNPGTGGLYGNNDGYLQVSNATAGNFGTRSMGPEYAGDWVAAGITQVRLWLDDVGAPDALEIHFSIGRGPAFPDPGNFWQYNVGFIPPPNTWKEFLVDLSSSADWTQTIGAGTFANALQTVDRIHLRHDLAPFGGSPDPGQGDFGIDHLLLTNGVVGVPLPGTDDRIARPVELAPPAPNPSRGPVTLALRAWGSSAVRVQILDAAGRQVRAVELPASAAGTRSWTWDGRDERGNLTAPGVYRARAWNGEGGTSRSLVRVR